MVTSRQVVKIDLRRTSKRSDDSPCAVLPRVKDKIEIRKR